MTNNLKSKIGKKIATAALAGALILNSVIPAFAQRKQAYYGPITYSEYNSEKSFFSKYKWYIGAAAILGGVAYSNEQKRLEDERKRAEEQAKYTADTDADGMLDSLEMQYFGNLSQPADSDYDGDGYTNKSEIDNGSDPTNPASMPGGDWHDLSASRVKACSVKPSKLENAVTINPASRSIDFALPLGKILIYGTAGNNSNINVRYNHKF